MSLRKVWKLLPWIGLSGLLILIILIKNRMPKTVIRAVALFSKYRELMPYMVAQAKLETANFTSRVYRENHNMFGMKWTDGRRGQNAKKGLLSPEGNYYAHYATDSASVFDLILWFEYKGFPVSVKDATEYARELKERNYFGADLEVYVRNLKYWGA